MTLAEYMDPQRFPATTQDDLAPQEQLMIDAYNYDSLKEFLEAGGKPDSDQKQRWKELQEKARHRSEVTAEVAKLAQESRQKKEQG